MLSDPVRPDGKSTQENRREISRRSIIHGHQELANTLHHAYHPG